METDHYFLWKSSLYFLPSSLLAALLGIKRSLFNPDTLCIDEQLNIVF